MRKNRRKSDVCPNCGDKNIDNYCPNCGQENTHFRTSMYNLLHDFAGDYFTFDSRFFRSVKPLLIKPGFLTSEYIIGRRAGYIPPIRLYIFISIFFFFILSFKSDTSIIKVGSGNTDTASAADSLKSTLQNVQNTLHKNIKDPAQLAITDSVLKKVGKVKWQTFTVPDDSLGHKKDDNEFDMKIGGKKIKINKDEFISGFRDNLPRMMFLLLPLFALILKILYIRSKRLYVEHIIFSLHFHAFVFLVLSLTSMFNFEWLDGLVFIGIGIYLFKALRVVYKQSRKKTFVKQTLLFFSYGFFIILSLLGTVVATAGLIYLRENNMSLLSILGG